MEKRKIDCEMYLISESNINGFKVWLYEMRLKAKLEVSTL